MLKKSVSKAAGESKPETYPQGYVEDFDEPRTPPLAGFFSILREEAVFLEIVLVNNWGRFNWQLSSLLEQTFDIFSDQI